MKQAYVMPYRLVVEVEPNYPELYTVTFQLTCPNCGHIHEIVERDGMPLLDGVAYSLKCGGLSIVFPWNSDRKLIAATDGTNHVRQAAVEAMFFAD